MNYTILTKYIHEYMFAWFALLLWHYHLKITKIFRQLKRILDILATDEESVTDLHEYYQHHQEELMRIVSILNPKAPLLLEDPDIVDEDDKSLESQTKPTTPSKSYTGDLTIYQDGYFAQKSLRHLSEDQIDLDKLLNRPEPPDSKNPLKTIKKIKDNFFSKKFNKRSSKPDIQDDQVSIKSTSSETSRISLSDIKKEIKKIKKLKMPTIITETTEDDGVGMASILARSVLHANTSLACIAESQDSENSRTSTLRRTSESEPNVAISDEGQTRPQSATGNVPENDPNNAPEIHCGSLENIKSNETVQPERKISESCPTSPMVMRNKNFLEPPEDKDFYGSVSSALSADSSEIYSSTDEDDESYDMKNEQEQMQTTSSVIQSVLGDVNFMAEMESKRSDMEIKTLDKTGDKELTLEHIKNLEHDSIDFSSSFGANVGDKTVLTKEENTAQPSIAASSSTCVPSKSNNSHHIKLHNPFAHKQASKSISAPVSPVEKKSFIYRSSKKIKRKLSKISKNSMIKSLSHYSLLPKKKHTDPKTAMSQPGSASDVTSKAPSDTVLGSPFLSYADLLSLDKQGFTSMTQLHKSDEHVSSKAFMYIGSEPVSRSSLSGPSFSRDDHHFSEQRSFKKERQIKPTGLVHTAMETILMDKVESLLILTSPDPNKTEDKKFFDDVNEKLEKVQGTREADVKPKGLIHSALETVLIDKVESLLLPTTPDPVKYGDKKFFDDASKKSERDRRSRSKSHCEDVHIKSKVVGTTEESKGLVHSAMETMLIDKVQALLLPTTPDAKSIEKQFFKDPSDKKDNEVNVKSLPPDHVESDDRKSYVDVRRKSDRDGRSRSKSHSEDVHIKSKGEKAPVESKGLVHSAIETMLIDKVQSLMLPTTPDAKSAEKQFFKDARDSKIENTKEIIPKLHSKVLDTKTVDIKSHSEREDLKTVEEKTQKKDKSINVSDKRNEKNPSEEKHSCDVLEKIKPVEVEKDKTTVKNDEKSQVKEKPNGKSTSKQLEKKERKLIRQDSVDSTGSATSSKMSKDVSNITSCKLTHAPMLQHFHPILSGAPLETIPSLPESSIDRSESLDTERVDINGVSVCCNSHAACGVDRSERERDRERDKCERDRGSPRHARHESYGGREPMGSVQQNASLNSTSTPLGIHRRSSDSDLSVTPKGEMLIPLNH